jgi:hypothetical protein
LAEKRNIRFPHKDDRFFGIPAPAHGGLEFIGDPVRRKLYTVKIDFLSYLCKTGLNQCDWGRFFFLVIDYGREKYEEGVKQ